MTTSKSLQLKIFFRVFVLSFLPIIIPGQRANGSERQRLIADKSITIVDRTNIPNDALDPIAFGKRELYKAIKTAGGELELLQHWTQSNRKTFLLLGLRENRVVGRLLGDDLNPCLSDPESVVYQWKETSEGLALVVSGSDRTGLMYALTELAQRVEDKGLEALIETKDTIESPENPIRGLDRFLTDYNDHSWFFSEEYWQYYIRHLALNRFNRLTLITGHTNSTTDVFMVPVYPYLVKVPGYEDVKLDSVNNKTPEQYLTQLRSIAKKSHEHGLEFVLGIWNHGISKNLQSQLPEDVQEYTDYCAEGMRMLLRQAPEIDGINLRINYEAGVGESGETAENFWKEIISAIGEVHSERGDLFLDLRAKGLTGQMRHWVLETGMDLSVPTKYTWESTGLPYHPTQMRRCELMNLDNMDRRLRYGYADFLTAPRDYDVIFRLWGIGTIRLFTWGDPDFASRFSQSTGFGGSRGFQVTPPLSAKVNTWKLFEDENLIHYTWEDQRYWAWYLMFGRLGYSFKTDPDVWRREFRTHYGDAANAMLAAYQAAGKVLPLITSAHLTKHPGVHNWAEMDTGGALLGDHNANHFLNDETYQDAEPGDPGLFFRISEYVEDLQEGNLDGRLTPIQVSALYANWSAEIHAALDEAEATGVPLKMQAEYRASRLDMLVMADLAKFHSLKTQAATDLVFYQNTGSVAYLRGALQAMQKAAERWHNMVGLIEGTYHSYPKFEVDLGTWADRSVEVNKDVTELEKMLSGKQKGPVISHWDGVDLETIQIRMQGAETNVPSKAKAFQALRVSLVPGTGEINKNENVILHYRQANMTEGPFNEIPMQWKGDTCFSELPGDYITAEYDLLLYFTGRDADGQTLMYPGLFSPDHSAPFFIVEIDQSGNGRPKMRENGVNTQKEKLTCSWRKLAIASIVKRKTSVLNK